VTPTQAERTAAQRRDELLFVSELVLDCELAPEELTALLDRRQQAVSRIQHLDAAVKSLTPKETAQWTEAERTSLNDLMEQGRQIAARICASDAQLVEKAAEKRAQVLELLKKNSLSKGYLSSSHSLKIRPPAILDDNA
jgi:hypothetical protein